MVSFLAVPLVAVITLDASPGQMGVLAAARSLPHLLVGLFAGVYVDRLRRRPILIWTDIGRGLLLATIPLAFALGLLWPLLSDVRTLHGRLETILEYSSE